MRLILFYFESAQKDIIHIWDMPLTIVGPFAFELTGGLPELFNTRQVDSHGFRGEFWRISLSSEAFSAPVRRCFMRRRIVWADEFSIAVEVFAWFF